MKNLSTDPITDGPRLVSVERRFFDDLEKSAADDKTSVETNKDDAPIDPAEVLDGEDPDPATEGTSEARWGQEAGKVQKGQQPGPRFSSAAKAQMIQGREEMLNGLFEHKGTPRGEEKVAMETFGQRARKVTGL